MQPTHYGLQDQGSPLGLREPSWLPTAAAVAVPVVFWAVSLILAVTDRALLETLTGERGAVQVAQAVVLLGWALLGAWIALALHRRNSRGWSLVYCGLAVGSLWAAGEEITWGQPLIGYSTPEWLADNLQGEANLHNLPGVNSTLHTIVWYGLWAMIVLSLATSYRWGSAKATQWRTELWVAPPMLIPTWLCFLSYSWVRALDQWWYQIDRVHTEVSRLQEPAELIFYGGVLAFLIMVAVRLHSGTLPVHART